MTAFEKFIYEHLHTLRRIVQFGTIVFVVLVPIFNKWGYNQVIGTFYSISIGHLEIVDPALVVQSILLTREIHFPLLLAGFIPLLLALFLGKVFCSWVCPFNLLAEWGDRIRKRIRPSLAKEDHLNPRAHHYWLIYGSILSVVAIFGLPLITLISLPGLITGQIADLLFFGTLGFEILFVFLILILEVFFAPRFWCKYACPVGATLALLRTKKTLKIKFEPGKCIYAQTKRLPCQVVCPLQLNPMRIDIYPYCYNCGECVDACRKEGQALNFTLQPLERFIPMDFVEGKKRMID